MKNNILRMAIAVICLAACRNESDRVESFIPGTYTKSVTGEFSKASDTLVITRLRAGTYQVVRHTGYQLIRNGSFMPEQHKTEIFNGTYDEQRQLLQEAVKGRAFSFDPAKRTLTVNARGVYRKVN